MEFTAKSVSEISVNKNVRSEILSYAKEEFDGEVTANFNLLLGKQNSNSSNSAIAGAFARTFKNKATLFNEINQENKSQAANTISGDLEEYLKKHNMALFGPYLAENHGNSTKPITVSFDPLDETKKSNIGWVLIPKSSQGAVANHGGIDAPFNLDDYELLEVQNVNDNYAYENPTIFVIPDDGNTNLPSSTNNSNNSNSTNRAIDCEQLSSTAGIELFMPEFRLNGNLSGAPWEQNLLDMWVITKDDISGLDLNGNGILNNSSSKLWSGKKVSRKNGRKKNWLNPNIPFLESNWEKNETEMIILISYKERDKQDEVSVNFKSVNNETTQTITSSVKITTKYKLMSYANFNRCTTLAAFDKNGGNGIHNGRRIYSFNGQLDLTLLPEIR